MQKHPKPAVKTPVSGAFFYERADGTGLITTRCRLHFPFSVRTRRTVQKRALICHKQRLLELNHNVKGVMKMILTRSRRRSEKRKSQRFSINV